jgi:hypothetical protein
VSDGRLDVLPPDVLDLGGFPLMRKAMNCRREIP